MCVCVFVCVLMEGKLVLEVEVALVFIYNLSQVFENIITLVLRRVRSQISAAYPTSQGQQKCKLKLAPNHHK